MDSVMGSDIQGSIFVAQAFPVQKRRVRQKQCSTGEPQHDSTSIIKISSYKNLN
jgi:hypothetical protein